MDRLPIMELITRFHISEVILMDQLKRPSVLQGKISKFEKKLERVMIKLGEYAKEHEYKILVLLLRKGYGFVAHNQPISERLKTEYGLTTWSDEVFKNEIRIKSKK